MKKGDDGMKPEDRLTIAAGNWMCAHCPCDKRAFSSLPERIRDKIGIAFHDLLIKAFEAGAKYQDTIYKDALKASKKKFGVK